MSQVLPMQGNVSLHQQNWISSCWIKMVSGIHYFFLKVEGWQLNQLNSLRWNNKSPQKQLPSSLIIALTLASCGQNFFAAFNLLGSWRVCSCTQLTNVYVDSLKCYVNKNWLHSLIMIYKTYTGIWKPVLQHSLQWNTKWDWNGAWFVGERGSSKVRGSQTIQSQTLFLQHPSLFLLLSCSCPKQKQAEWQVSLQASSNS